MLALRQLYQDRAYGVGDFVSAVLSIHSKYKHMVSSLFSSHKDFSTALDQVRRPLGSGREWQGRWVGCSGCWFSAASGLGLQGICQCSRNLSATTKSSTIGQYVIISRAI